MRASSQLPATAGRPKRRLAASSRPGGAMRALLRGACARCRWPVGARPHAGDQPPRSAACPIATLAPVSVALAPSLPAPRSTPPRPHRHRARPSSMDRAGGPACRDGRVPGPSWQAPPGPASAPAPRAGQGDAGPCWPPLPSSPWRMGRPGIGAMPPCAASGLPCCPAPRCPWLPPCSPGRPSVRRRLRFAWPRPALVPPPLPCRAARARQRRTRVDGHAAAPREHAVRVILGLDLAEAVQDARRRCQMDARAARQQSRCCRTRDRPRGRGSSGAPRRRCRE